MHGSGELSYSSTFVDDETRLAIDRYVAFAKRGPALFPSAIGRAEELIGPLPEALRYLYRTCGNGHFGAGFRPLIFEGDPEEARVYDFGETSVVGATLIERDHVTDDTPWPPGLLRLFNWGCAVESCVDTLEPRLRVVRYDPHWLGEAPEAEIPTRAAYATDVVGPQQASAFVVERESLASWLDLWREGHSLAELQRMGEPRLPS